MKGLSTKEQISKEERLARVLEPVPASERDSFLTMHGIRLFREQEATVGDEEYSLNLDSYILWRSREIP